MSELDPKLIALADAWLETFNKAEAYQRTHPNAKRNTCWTNGERMLRKAEVQSYIAERLKQMAMEADEVLSRLSAQARGNIAVFITITKDGFVHFDFSSDDAKAHLHLIKKIKTKRSRRVEGRGKAAQVWEDETVEVELYDSQKALDLLARYHNLYAEKDPEGNTDEERIARIMEIFAVIRRRVDADNTATRSDGTR